MRPLDLSRILSKHKRGWIALTPDNKKLVAAANTLKRTLEKSREKGVSDPTVFKAAPVEHLFAG